MAEPVASNFPTSLDDNDSLGGDQQNLKQLTLDIGVNSSIQTISVAEDITSIAVPCYLLLDSELIYAPSKGGGDFTSCIRGAGGTTAVLHNINILIYITYAANLFNQLKRAIIAIETALGIGIGKAAGTDLDTGTNNAKFATAKAIKDAHDVPSVVPGTSGNVLTSDGTDWTSAPAGGGGELKNYLINGGFDFAQRQTPGTLTTITDKKYGADRWWITRENADAQYNRNDATGETGLTSMNYGLLKKITNTGKIFMCQVVAGRNSVPLRSKTIIFQIKMKASASKTIRMGIFELQTAGTIDAPPATLVTAFGANSTDPTMGTNVAVITAAASKSVTTSWQSFSVSVTVPSNSKNIICAVWTDSQFAANDTLSIAEAGLFVASTVQDWKPPLAYDDLERCQYFYEKTWDTEVKPGTAVATSEFDNRFPATPAAGFAMINWRYKVEKFKAPAVHCYDAAGTIDKITYVTDLAGTLSNGQVVTVDHIGTSASRIYTDSTTVKCGVIANVTAEAEIL